MNYSARYLISRAIRTLSPLNNIDDLDDECVLWHLKHASDLIGQSISEILSKRIETDEEKRRNEFL